MKTTIKFAALGAVALAASSSAALADSQLLPGITAGIALGAPLPEGVYDISIGAVQQRSAVGGVEGVVPVWLIWSTPYQIAGGRIELDGTIGYLNADTSYAGPAAPQGFNSGLTNATIHWGLGNGWNVSGGGGVFWASDSYFGEKNAHFLGQANVAYIHGGWQFSANTFYGTGDATTGQADYFNYDLAAIRSLGKFQIGAVAYGNEDTHAFNNAAKQSAFAVGGLVGYDFGSFSANFKLTQVVAEQNYFNPLDATSSKATTAWLTIVKPLWNPASEGPLK